MKILALAIFCLAWGCATPTSKNYVADWPSQDQWRKTSESPNSVTFRFPKEFASLAIHSRCHMKSSVDLASWRDAYVKNLHSFTVLTESSRQLGPHEAHLSFMEGYLSGRRVLMTLVLLQEKDCLFDLTLMTDPGLYDPLESDLLRLATSIQY